MDSFLIGEDEIHEWWRTAKITSRHFWGLVTSAELTKSSEASL